MKYLGIFSIICWLSGCATTPVPYTDATSVPQDNLLEGYKQFSNQAENRSRVIVVRDSGMLGAALPAKLSINGTEVAKLWSSERLELFLEPGTYIFGVEPSLKRRILFSAIYSIGVVMPDKALQPTSLLPLRGAMAAAELGR